MRGLRTTRPYGGVQRGQPEYDADRTTARKALRIDTFSQQDNEIGLNNIDLLRRYFRRRCYPEDAMIGCGFLRVWRRQQMRAALIAVSAVLVVPGARLRAQDRPMPSAAMATVDLSTPNKALGSFAQALASSDWDNAVRCVIGASSSEFTHQLSTGQKSPITNIRIEHLVLKISNESDAVATFTAVFVMTAGMESPPPESETIALHKGESGWQIVPPDIKRFKPGKGGILTNFSMLLANPEIALAARKKAREAREAQKKMEDADNEAIQNPQHLVIGQMARLYQDKSQRTIFVAENREQVEGFQVYLSLKEMREPHPKPFTKTDDGFTNAEYVAAVTQAKANVDKWLTSGAVQWLPANTPVRIVAYAAEKNLQERMSELTEKNELQVALDPTLQRLRAWQVAVQSGSAKGKTVWALNVASDIPTIGDKVTLCIPNKATATVPAAIDPAAAQTLPSSGQPASGAAATQFARLLRTKRVVLLPAGQRCLVEDAMEDGSLLLVNPTEGAQKGKRFFINPANAVLAP